MTDYPYWQSRQYYYQRIQAFISNDISIDDFIPEILYLGLSNKKEASALKEDFQRQANIDLDPKSFGFSKIISELIPILEGFDQDPDESFFTETEFREIVENLAVKLKKYSIK